MAFQSGGSSFSLFPLRIAKKSNSTYVQQHVRNTVHMSGYACAWHISVIASMSHYTHAHAVYAFWLDMYVLVLGDLSTLFVGSIYIVINYPEVKEYQMR